MIVLIVNFAVAAGNEERTKDLIRKMQEHTRREPGCRRYVGHRSLQDPRRFCFYEVYEDEAAPDAVVGPRFRRVAVRVGCGCDAQTNSLSVLPGRCKYGADAKS